MAGTALILQHQDDAPAGLLTDALSAAGLSVHTAHLDRGEPLPDPGEPAIAVTLGSDASATSTDRAWIATELGWLRAADAAGTPILGLCFGAQALALALGGQVSRARRPERGWVTVTSSDAAIAAGPWLAWHDDEIGLPPDARLLARNDSGVQAYRLRDHWGIQFHPEVTPAIVDQWVDGSSDQLLDRETMLADTARESQRAAADAARLFAAFIDSAGLSPSRSR